jgi:hypothetical protein
MKKLIALGAVAATLLLTGCATPQQMPVTMSKTALQTQGTRVGVAMSKLPKVDTSFPGAGCLLCYAAASAANSSLTTHTQALPSDDVARFKTDIAEVLRKKGHEVTVIDESLQIDALPKTDGAPGKSRRDFASLRSKYNVDKLIVLEISELGITRTYASYIPTGEPQSIIQGSGYMVNLADNSLEWYQPLREVRSADGKWDEPSFPGLTNAYFQVIEGARDSVLKPFVQ